MLPTSSYHSLEKKLGYRFKDPTHLQLALTHPSYHPRSPSANNQRLEYLGDAILQFTISAWLYQKLPQATEGQLTTTRAALVNHQRLAHWAQSLQLSHHLRIGKSAAPRPTPAILADACEAIIGAIYIDGGIEPAQNTILQYYEHHFPDLHTLPLQIHNPKGTLQEWLQQHGAPPPTYRHVHTEGPPHAAQYTVEIQALNYTGRATATSKKQAEIEAARAAIRFFHLDDKPRKEGMIK